MEEAMERYYNGPKSKLMDELYDRLTEHGDTSEYPDWSILSLYIAREIEQIEINHLAALGEKDEEIEKLNKFLNNRGKRIATLTAENERMREVEQDKKLLDTKLRRGLSIEDIGCGGCPLLEVYTIS